jgi:hypothetical protein
VSDVCSAEEGVASSTATEELALPSAVIPHDEEEFDRCMALKAAGGTLNTVPRSACGEKAQS